MEKEKREMAEVVREKTEEEECKKQKIRIEFSLKMLLFFLEKKLKTDFFLTPPCMPGRYTGLQTETYL